MNCPECGKTNFDDSTKCAFCGKAFRAEPAEKNISNPSDTQKKESENGKIKCPGCGAGNNADTPCCSLCGEILKKEAAPAPEPAQPPADSAPEPYPSASETQPASVPSFMSGKRSAVPSILPSLIMYVIVIGVLGGGGYWVYSTFIAAPTFGIRTQAPLGSLNEIRGYLLGRAYEEKEPDDTEIPDLPVSGDLHFFTGKSPVRDWDDFITLVADENGDLIAINASFFAQYNIDPYTTSRSGKFMTLYWKTVFNGREVKLKEIRSGKGIWLQYAKTASDSTEDAEGRWVKQSVNRRQNKYARTIVTIALGNLDE